MTSISTILSVLAIVAVGQAYASYITEYDQQFSYSCHNNQYLTHLRSHHSNHHEDRVWNFGCAKLPQWAKLIDCTWTNYVNSFDQLIGFMCPRSRIVTGISSYHSNHREDRRFKFLCCTPSGKILHSCVVSEQKNHFDGDMHFATPQGRVLAGMVSEHSNSRQDRIFRFITCLMRNAFKRPGPGPKKPVGRTV